MVAVTGSTGYIGGALTARLVRAGCPVRRVGRTLPPAPDPNCHDILGDVVNMDWKDVVRDVDVVFHLAGQTSAYRSEADPLADHDINVRPVLAMLEACRQQGNRPVVVLAGAATQIGVTRADQTVEESLPLRPATVYDIDKTMAETYLAHYVTRGWVHGCSLRLSNVFGPGAPSSAPDRNVLNRMVIQALTGKAITIFGDGSNLRDYVFIDDVVDAFLAAGQGPVAADGRGFYLCRGRSVGLGEAFRLVAATVERLSGRGVTVLNQPWPEGMLDIEHRNFVGDNSAIRKALAWSPSMTLEEGIEATVRFFMNSSAVS